MDAAEASFKAALEEAKLSRLPMLVVLAARDWRKCVLEPAGDVSAGDKVIDAALAKMKKTRAQIERVL